MRLPALATGQYEAALFLDGDTPAAKPIRALPFTHQENFVWKGNRLGMDDVVIPPFTPLTVQGRVVRAVLRRHTHGRQRAVVAGERSGRRHPERPDAPGSPSGRQSWFRSRRS